MKIVEATYLKGLSFIVWHVFEAGGRGDARRVGNAKIVFGEMIDEF